jgi:hypothetical protein
MTKPTRTELEPVFGMFGVAVNQLTVQFKLAQEN